MDTNDGGPAFPGERKDQIGNDHDGKPVYSIAQYPGMSLRDWFAGQAMLGFLSNPESTKSTLAVAEEEDWEPAAVSAAIAYAQADAMLAEREKGWADK